MSGTSSLSFDIHPAALLLAFALSVVLHELGHLLPALWFGFHVSRGALGPICVTRAHGPWKLQYSRSWWAASVVAIPRDETAWRRRMLTVVAGGPIASLVTCFLAVYLRSALAPTASGGAFLSALAQLNLFLFLFLIPNSRNASVRNDARLFLTIWENGCEAEQIRLYHRVTQLQIAGVRPRGFPRDLITQVAAAAGNRDLMLFSALTVFLWALDSGDVTLADTWDRRANRLIEDYVLRLSDTVLCESACFDIVHRNAPESATQKLNAVHFASLPPWLQHRAKAALQITQGAHQSAILNLRQAKASLPPHSSYREFEFKILDLLEQRTASASPRIRVAQAAA